MAQAFPIANSFSIITGQSSFPGQIPADPNKYSVKDDHGTVFLTAIHVSGPGSLLLIRDAAQTEVLGINANPGSQVVGLLAPNGAHFGNILVSTKPIKEHKKDKGKETKRQVVLQNSTTGATIYSMSGKMKHGGSTLEMKIKSFLTTSHNPTSFDKKHKDKSKKAQIGEVSGNLFTGTHVKLSSHGINLSHQEKYNIIGLLIGYMEIERHNHGRGHAGIGAGIQQHSQLPNPGNALAPTHAHGGLGTAIHQHSPIPNPGSTLAGTHGHSGFGAGISPHSQNAFTGSLAQYGGHQSNIHSPQSQIPGFGSPVAPQMGFSSTNTGFPGFVQPGSQTYPNHPQHH